MMIILMYHRVTDLAFDPWNLAISPARFEEQMSILGQIAEPQPLSMTESECPPARGVAVTFDDGYADNLMNAAPILQKHGIPATFFVTSGFVVNPREMWWDELEAILFETDPLPRRLELELDGESLAIDGLSIPSAPDETHRNWKAWHEPPSALHALYRRLWEACLALTWQERQLLLGRLWEWGGGVRDPRPSHRGLTPDELRELGSIEDLEIGAHTESHAMLSSLPIETQCDEITAGRAVLETIIGRKVLRFAYPFGKKEHYTDQTRAVVEAQGFLSACSNFPGAVGPRSDRFQLPRVVVANWPGEQFAGVVTHWLNEAGRTSGS